MKRCWFGFGMLIFLLAVSLTVSILMGNFQKGLSAMVSEGADLTFSHREKAQERIDQARGKWMKLRSVSAGLADHAPMNEADALFALLTPDADPQDFRENALRLAEVLRQLGQSQLPTLENIF